jgi:glutamate formiminotransferase
VYKGDLDDMMGRKFESAGRMSRPQEERARRGVSIMAKLIECIPNFSTSKEQDPEVFNQLVDLAKSAPGCTLFDVQSDGSHNRCVFTLIGSPEGIEEVAFQLCKKASELIDMNKHHGQHPRMGATDVIPFVPQTKDVTLEECIELSKRVAE